MVREEFGFLDGEGIQTCMSCFLQTPELCLYGRDMMGLSTNEVKVMNLAAEGIPRYHEVAKSAETAMSLG